MVRGAYDYVKKKSSNKKPPAINDALMTEALKLPADINLDACWTAYRMDNETCGITGAPHPKTKNCRDNPYCLHYLGLEKIQKLKSQHCDKELVILNKRDITKQPCGLVNSGNFCYVNSFLQIWFNDLVFRRCVYQWRPHPDFVQHDESKMDVQAVMNAMQKLFFTMQFSPYEAANAEELIRLLRLDDEQHDVQEFNTLFFDALERNLMRHPNGAYAREVIRKRFEAHISQVIRCDVCNSQRESSSLYCSLNISIKDHNSLTDAINAFLSAEKLMGYRCEQCGLKDTSSRSARFTDLPSVLIIQFNRFIFDDNGRHKKLKTPIQYPRVLSERVLKQNDAGEGNYELSGVMIHQGPNTHCGHYYDLIKSPGSNEWFSYNDKTVVKVKQPGVNVEGEKIQRVSPDMTECYALIYRRVGSDDDVTLDNVGMPPEEVVHNLRRAFEDENMANNGCVSMWKRQISSRCTALMNLWNDLKVSDELKSYRSESKDQIAFLPSALLAEILSKEFEAIETMPELSTKEFLQLKCRNSDDSEDMDDDNFDHLFPLGKLASTKHSLCPHDKVPIASIFNGELKAVCREVAEDLLQRYKINVDVMNEESGELLLDGEPKEVSRLMTANDLCVDCVQQRKERATAQQCLEQNLQLPFMKKLAPRTCTPSAHTLRTPAVPPPEGSLWVCSKHLQSFKKLALKQIEHAENQQRPQEVPKKLVFSVDAATNGNSQENESEEIIMCDESDEEKPTVLNDELYCPHERLTIYEKRTWVTPEEWEELRKSFPTNYRDPISTTDDECLECLNEWIKQQNEQQDLQSRLNGINDDVGDVIRRIDRRRQWDETELGETYTEVICEKFVKYFTRMKKAKVVSEIPRICQNCLLCEHDLPYLSLEMADRPSLNSALPVTKDEWQEITASFSRHTPYSPPRKIAINKTGYEVLCEDCHIKHLQYEENKNYIYPDGANIYVKLNEENENKPTKLLTTRQEATKLYKFKMRSTEKVLDLKLQIYEKIKCSPIDQLLLRDNQELKNDMTLEDARIRSNNSDEPLTLIVQQACSDSEMSDDTQQRPVERGFTGTALFG